MRNVLKNKKGKKYGKWNIDELENLSQTIPDFEIKAIKTKHKFAGNVVRIDDDVSTGSERIALAYNRYFSQTDRLLANYETFSDEFSSILHRKVHAQTQEQTS